MFEKLKKWFLYAEHDIEKPEDDNVKVVLEENTEPLRPDSFKSFVNQEKAKFLLENSILAAKKQDKPIEHTLFVGGAGCGKTTLAWLSAKERGCNIINATANSLEKPADIADLFIKAEPNDIIFIDEIHRLKPEFCEFFYQPMEDCKGSFLLPNGGRAFCTVFPFTLIGSTAYEQGNLPKPFLDRFGLKLNLEPYELRHMEEITRRSVRILKIDLDEECSNEVAKRSRFTPRLVNANIRRIKDYLIARDVVKADLKCVDMILETCGYDTEGLSPIDRKILIALNRSKDGRSGVKAISANTGVDMVSLEDYYEPYLLQQGYLARTLRGREITEKGRKYLELKGLSKC